ncbi:MAG: hypothetical protein WC962_00595 [Phycisphaerae bacterium]|jgi:hypothetical protein
MAENNYKPYVHTNVRVFFRIAQESYQAMKKYFHEHAKPKPNGESGHIFTLDPEQKSFKNAFITIVFSGVFLEALLHLLIVERHGLRTFNEYDRKSYEEKFKLLGCSDQSIIDLCEKYRAVRREIVHEKAYFDSDSAFRIAQDEADVAIELVNKVVDYFKVEVD